MRFARGIGGIVLAFALATSAFAADVQAVLTQSRIVRDNGVERTETADHVKPGDLVEYTVTFRNTTKAPVSNVLGSLPIPRGMVYQPGSASPAGALATTDGATFAPAPLKRTVVRNGVKVEEPVPASEYRALRWTLGSLAPGQSAVVKARVKLVTPNNAQPAY